MEEVPWVCVRLGKGGCGAGTVEGCDGGQGQQRRDAGSKFHWIERYDGPLLSVKTLDVVCANAGRCNCCLEMVVVVSVCASPLPS